MPAAPYKLLRPLLFALPPETAHRAAVSVLRFCAAAAEYAPPQMPVAAMGLQFPNPLGLAAGFDKNADSAAALASLGFGFIESGAITPLPQTGNPPPRIFRLPRARALINRMGFNNCGMLAAERNLRILRKRRFVLGINLGKNAETPPQNAAEDYARVLETLYESGDFFTINISSPNTPGLRDLQTPRTLRKLLDSVVRRRDELAEKRGRRAPLAVKLSPDMDDKELSAAAEEIAAAKMDGVVACNTTISRPPEVAALPRATENGGLSGAPLAARALEMTRRLRALLPEKTAIIGVGGVMNGEDAKQRMQAGADLVQIYTGLIYQGPALPRQIIRALRDA
ncbi:MAG: quinone-dependent dihydroorotate dehydrogenase [Gammaproteobacteria bacterium]